MQLRLPIFPPLTKPELLTLQILPLRHYSQHPYSARNTTPRYLNRSFDTKCHRIDRTTSLSAHKAHPQRAIHISRSCLSQKQVDTTDPGLIRWKTQTKMATISSDDTYSKAFNLNSKWRRSLAEEQPELFEKLGKGQSPQILWIGCADSRCPETTILGLQPGEIFCHRNIANVLVPTDLNSLAVIQYAVQYLKVKHIVICGHTSCGGIAAALDNKKLGLIDTWLLPLRALRRDNLALLESLDEKERNLKLVELNVRAGLKVLQENPVVIDALQEREVNLHGLIYNVGTGELKELDIGEESDIVKQRAAAFKTNGAT